MKIPGKSVKSRVYFIPVRDSDDLAVITARLRVLVDESGILDFLQKGAKCAVKIHFGEEGNAGFVRPEYVRVICDGIAARKASAFLADTNTLYKGRRTNSDSHLKIAREHGFTKESTGVEVIIPDDTKEENAIDIKINKKFIKTAALGRIFIDADAIIGISHFKGHIMTGFGGALKNIGMGCATRKGKLAQHSDIAPVVYENQCVGCGECEKACPAGAIRIENDKAVIDGLKCIGCASCIAACTDMAIDVPWESGGGVIQEKMIEYACAVLKGSQSSPRFATSRGLWPRDKPACFFNFAIKITKECDCLAKDDPPVAPDIGIFASTDPVSIDKTCYDLINKACGKDIFRELHPNRDGTKQLKHAEALGLGKLDYELIELSAKERPLK